MKKILACIIILYGLIISSTLCIAFSDSTNIQQPLNGMYLTDGFKPVRDNSVSNYSHMSCDYNSSSSQTIYPFAEGTVVKVETNVTRQDYSGSNARGNYVVIEHTQFSDFPIYSWYQHMKYGSIHVKVGDHVSFSTVLGTLGNTGWTLPEGSGYHLHFTITTDINDARLTNDLMLAQYGSKFDLVRGQVYDGDKIVLEDGRIWYNPERVFATNGECLGDGCITGTEMTYGYDKIFPDGDYYISSALDPSYILSVDGSDIPAANRANVFLHHSSTMEPSIDDVWTISFAGNGFYSIKQKGTNMSLNVAYGSAEQCTNIEVYPSNDSPAQRWAISKRSDKGYCIQAKASGFALDANGGVVDGANIQQYTSHNGENQAWLLIPYKPNQPVVSGRYIMLSALDNTFELDVEGNVTGAASGANVQIWDNASLSQYNSFDLEPLSNGYYKIIHSSSSNVLNANGVGANCTRYGENINILTSNNSYAQEWALIETEYGYALCSHLNGYVLDVQGGNKANGANIMQNGYHGGHNQSWTFVPAEYTITYDANGGIGAPPQQVKYYMTNSKLSSAEPTWENHTFLGWSEYLSADTATYVAGSDYMSDSNIYLYAVWMPETPEPVSLTVTPSDELLSIMAIEDY